MFVALVLGCSAHARWHQASADDLYLLLPPPTDCPLRASLADRVVLHATLSLTAAVCPQDEDYTAAGATIVDKAASWGADIVLKVKPPTLQEADMIKERARWVGVGCGSVLVWV